MVGMSYCGRVNVFSNGFARTSFKKEMQNKSQRKLGLLLAVLKSDFFKFIHVSIYVYVLFYIHINTLQKFYIEMISKTFI